MPVEDLQFLETKLKSPFILTFESCKGLEFDIVIMPFFEYAQKSLNNRRLIKTPDGVWKQLSNADGTAKMWTTPNHYYVAATRARSLLYILCESRPVILNFWQETDNRLFDDVL